jgi:hypothetical protein
MATKTHFYIALVIAAGGGLLASCIASGTFGFSDAYLVYCFLAWSSSTLKVRLPGMTGTMSMAFLFVLVAVAVFTLSETVLMAAVAAAVQCCLRTRLRPKVVQVAFNVAAWTISSGMSYRISHWFAKNRDERLIVLMPVAACLFFVANTLLISGVLSMVDGKPLFRMWQHCYLWTFPYYLAGSAIAALTVEAGRTEGWRMSLLILPAMYLLYLFYRTCVQRMAPAVSETQSTIANFQRPC